MGCTAYVNTAYVEEQGPENHMALCAKYRQTLTDPADMFTHQSPVHHCGYGDSEEHCFGDKAVTINYSYARFRDCMALGSYLRQ